jgi:phosphopantothenoylcysteine decarboxylase/phosphopantothenate--cysteine ligase
MNTNMWNHPAVAANVATLAGRGVRFIEPGDGYLACGWIGKGRLAEPEAIVAAVEQVLGRSSSLAGRRVLVTAGPTYEDLDPVRFVGNRSSGRMGFAIAEEAGRRGADVVLVAGPTPLAPPAAGTLVRVRTAAEMHRAVMAHVDAVDAVVMAAAVADYTPADGERTQKMQKGDRPGPLTLTLVPTPDILAELGKRRAGGARPVLVGFAAETGEPVPAARRKLEQKQVDLVVANDVTTPGAGFEVETNVVTFVGDGTVDALPRQSKRDVAAAILDRVERLLEPQPAVVGP